MQPQIEFKINSVLLQSDQMSDDIELNPVVTDIDIYEDIRKPYLTADIVFLDNSNIIDGAMIIGGEKITINIEKNTGNSSPIIKTFYVHRITQQNRTGINAQVIALHLVEECFYISNLYNINRFYEGKGSEIIKKIVNEFLEKQLVYGPSEPSSRRVGGIQTSETQQYKLIVPNLNPLQAAMWIKNKLTTIDGWPFYLYSTFVSDNLVLKDLQTLMTDKILNPNQSFVWSHMNITPPEPHIARKTILNYKNVPSEDLIKLISEGFIGSKFSYINTALDTKDKVTFDYDIVEDFLKPAIEDGTLSKNQPNPSFSPEFKHNNKSFNKIQSRHIALMGGSNPYRVTNLPEDAEEMPQYPLALGEAYDEGTYKQFVNSYAARQLLVKSPINMTVNGFDFIDGDKHSTIGNQLRCVFKKSDPSSNFDEDDKKLSGDYLIYRARHLIKRDAYHISMNMVKMGNRS